MNAGDRRAAGLPALPPMAERLSARARGRPLRLKPMEQVHAVIDGRPVVFHLNMADDPVQDCHRRGHFYEEADLARLATLLPPAPVVLDVGANVGNHALYFALCCGARRVIPVEPNPLALEPLVANILANRLEGRVSLSHLGFGLADRDEAGFSMKEHDRNLGATRMLPATGGPLTVRRGDAAFPRARPDLVKVDVEGMEMEVLRGLERLVRRSRPVLMVEVRNEHGEDFAAWARDREYTLLQTSPVGRSNANHILLPPGHPAARAT